MNAIAHHALHHHLQTGALQIRGLNKAYRIEGRSLPVLQDIHLDVRPGEFVSIVGASGCGKSTLLRLIVGLEAEYEGDILLDGKRIAATSLERGIVFQDHRLFPWMTVSQNIALALKNHPLPQAEKDRQVAEHIALVNLSGFENAYPHQLSGGMAQRAAIARALINKPKVLLLDEPLGALDALTRVHLQRELQRIWAQQRCTVIMVTHDIEEALYLGERVIVMDAHPGRIKHQIEVDLPHPRDRTSAVLQGYKEQLLEELVGH
ncbi:MULTISPECIES: ABC transporter ATP-binding protein [Pseudomonas]|uniref:ABC transporter ATP-binding protein n=2 Tax=Pseudomonas gingeri TaxID=117681 RepID=A0A7Y7YDQ9_9PSED|nr:MULTISPECIES: ABC transporter ATP-binding protein [Pseudomonas]NVZ29307.1 ABC transporter ATP-binding protein [Pseudomonas gingeri]NVZ65686.1 ABC transporter ATP-binding protein [Pseudomonas gingeri]NVZ73405.1 ABC transporter ATP-binding protein [Pseudomonas gingeri]NWA03343.1 ABC transporter ATP-binding protein [Pseudomonas gingeri]NWA08857.1 ABC transporter ATP-binding protein [Pseudomonas gingeri]